jgi:hypothetical protein
MAMLIVSALVHPSNENLTRTMSMHSYQVPFLNGGEGEISKERGRVEVGKEGEIQYKLFFHCLNKLNK